MNLLHCKEEQRERENERERDIERHKKGGVEIYRQNISNASQSIFNAACQRCLICTFLKCDRTMSLLYIRHSTAQAIIRFD